MKLVAFARERDDSGPLRKLHGICRRNHELAVRGNDGLNGAGPIQLEKATRDRPRRVVACTIVWGWAHSIETVNEVLLETQQTGVFGGVYRLKMPPSRLGPFPACTIAPSFFGVRDTGTILHDADDSIRIGLSDEQ